MCSDEYYKTSMLLGTRTVLITPSRARAMMTTCYVYDYIRLDHYCWEIRMDIPWDFPILIVDGHVIDGNHRIAAIVIERQSKQLTITRRKK